MGSLPLLILLALGCSLTAGNFEDIGQVDAMEKTDNYQVFFTAPKVKRNALPMSSPGKKKHKEKTFKKKRIKNKKQRNANKKNTNKKSQKLGRNANKQKNKSIKNKKSNKKNNQNSKGRRKKKSMKRRNKKKNQKMKIRKKKRTKRLNTKKKMINKNNRKKMFNKNKNNGKKSIIKKYKRKNQLNEKPSKGKSDKKHNKKRKKIWQRKRKAMRKQKSKTEKKGRTLERNSACNETAIVREKTTRYNQMENRRRQSIRAPKFHKIMGNKCNKSNSFTTAAQRTQKVVSRAGGKKNCLQDPTETILKLLDCSAEVCKACASPLNSNWQELYPICETDAKKLKIKLENATTCVDIKAANSEAAKLNKKCGGPFQETANMKNNKCSPKNKECKELQQKARDLEIDCIAPTSTSITPSNSSTVPDLTKGDETQINRTARVKASLSTFLNGTGNLLNNLGLGQGEGSDGELSASAQAAFDSIVRADSVSDNPSCSELISYAANLIDFSNGADDTLSEQQTDAAAGMLGRINSLVASGAAATALEGCEKRQNRIFFIPIFRWIVWRCYYWYWNWLVRLRCRRLLNLCISSGSSSCLDYCSDCNTPWLIGGIWWLGPIFQYQWYPTDPCQDRTKPIFNCPQCPAPATPTPNEATSPAPVETTSPAPVETSSPAPVETTSPAPVETSSPAPVETSSPAPVETTSPAPGETTSPAPVETSSLAPVETTSPAPADSTSPSAPITTSKFRGKRILLMNKFMNILRKTKMTK